MAGAAVIGAIGGKIPARDRYDRRARRTKARGSTFIKSRIISTNIRRGVAAADTVAITITGSDNS